MLHIIAPLIIALFIARRYKRKGNSLVRAILLWIGVTILVAIGIIAYVSVLDWYTHQTPWGIIWIVPLMQITYIGCSWIPLSKSKTSPHPQT